MEKCKKMCEKEVEKGWRFSLIAAKNEGITKQIKQIEKKIKQDLRSKCRIELCNPRCKGTEFENEKGWYTRKRKEHQRMINNNEVTMYNILNKRKMTEKNINESISSYRPYRNQLIKNIGLSDQKAEHAAPFKKGYGSALLNKNSFYPAFKIGSPYRFKSGKILKTKKMSPATYKKTMKSRGALSGCREVFFL
jgi:hypothetical protein